MTIFSSTQNELTWGRALFLTDFSPSLSLSAPCVCNVITPVGPVPVPLLNIAVSSASIPNIPNIFTSGMPSQNLLTLTPFSNGSEVSAPLGGLVSFMFCSAAKNIFGSLKVFQGGAPVKRMLDPTVQNGFLGNSLGCTLTPGNFKQLVMM